MYVIARVMRGSLNLGIIVLYRGMRKYITISQVRYYVYCNAVCQKYRGRDKIVAKAGYVIRSITEGEVSEVLCCIPEQRLAVERIQQKGHQEVAMTGKAFSCLCAMGFVPAKLKQCMLVYVMMNDTTKAKLGQGNICLYFYQGNLVLLQRFYDTQDVFEVRTSSALLL